MRAPLVCDCDACRDIARARRRRESAVMLALLLAGCACILAAVALRGACEWGCR